MADHAPWLVAIDLQRIFSDPLSPWSSPRYEDAADGVARLRPAFGERAVFTRYVAPLEPRGAWRPYFELWPFALVAPDDPLYALDPRFADEPRIETRETFGKWDAGLVSAVAETTDIVLAGVSTDCCVISTALAAADSGVRIRVVADACAGSTVADHERALAIMGLYAPLIELTTVAEVLAG